MSAPQTETIRGLLADPLIQAMMRADKVERDDLAAMLEGVAAKLAAAPAPSYKYRNPRFAPPARRLKDYRIAAARFSGCEARPCG